MAIRSHRARAFIFLALAFTHPARACPTTPLATIPLAIANGTIGVAVTIDNHPARMVLDTGAQRTVLAKAAADRLGIPRDEWVATTMSGVGGVERHRNATPRAMSLGGIPLARNTRGRDLSLAVADLAPAALDGLLGRDMLASFALDLDLPNRAVSLYTPCPDPRPPYQAQALPTTNPADTALVLRARLDGVAVSALLDTGAALSVLTAPGMARMGLTVEALAGREGPVLGGIGPRAVQSWSYRFTLFELGPTRSEPFPLTIAPIRATPIVEMLLGADWLAGKRLWIDFPARLVWLAR
jgi:hypothetical protein